MSEQPISGSELEQPVSGSQLEQTREQPHPRPLGLAIIELPYLYLKALFTPFVRMFEYEGARASWGIVWIQILLLILIPGALGLVRGLTHAAVIRSTSSTALYDSIASLVVGTSVIGTLLQTLIVPIVFFIGVTIQFLLAKAFRGEGSYLAQSYTTLLYEVPLTIVSSVLSTVLVLIQFSGKLVVTPVVSLALFIYGIVLNVFAIAGVHRLTRGRATAVVLIPYIVGALLACGLTVYFTRAIIDFAHNLR